MNKNIILIGFMGCGKTTIGKALAKELSYDFIDTDDMVEVKSASKISQIFESKGEGYFRLLESKALKEASTYKETVISTGGGIVTIESNIETLKKGLIIYLKASPGQIYKNIRGDITRPLLNGEDQAKKIRQLLEERQELYEGIANYTIEVDGKTPSQICHQILRSIK